MPRDMDTAALFLSVRVSGEEKEWVTSEARRLTAELGFRVTISNVVRRAIGAELARAKASKSEPSF